MTDERRMLPGRELPPPDTVSPAIRELVGRAPISLTQLPRNHSEWRAMLDAGHRWQVEQLAGMAEKFAVDVSEERVAGVRCYRVAPKSPDSRSSRHLLIGFHCGGFIGGAGEAGLLEMFQMAGLAKMTVLSVDYRMPPDHPFPAAIDDAIAVWRALSSSDRKGGLAVFGSSAGGGLVLSLIQRARREGTPWSDLSKTGDSYYTNAGVDNYIVYEGLHEAAARLYANGRDLKDPLLSPVYGDFTGFPPAFLYTGTRDLYLSNTVRVHQELLRAESIAHLEVFEGQSHGCFLLGPVVNAPEAAELYAHIGRFLREHLRSNVPAPGHGDT
jgi:epsilon-lactone hydrolase